MTDKFKEYDWTMRVGDPILTLPFVEGMPSPDKARAMTAWVRTNSDRYENKLVKMYHATAASLPIEAQGLKPTTDARRRSYQSASGYVYLANTPERAKNFGDLGNQSNCVIYEVLVRIRHMKADTDQLNNLRSVGQEMGDSIGESIIYGGGARVKGKIDAWAVRKMDPDELNPKMHERDAVSSLDIKQGKTMTTDNHGERATELQEEILCTCSGSDVYFARMPNGYLAITDGVLTDYVNFRGVGDWVRESDQLQVPPGITTFLNSFSPASPRLEQIRSEIVARLVALGWEASSGVALATKHYKTAVGVKQAFAYLADYGTNEVSVLLTGDYQSQGNNALSTSSMSIAKHADTNTVNEKVALYAQNVDAVVAQTYAMKLLKDDSPSPGM